MGKKTTQADKPLLIMQTGNASSHVRQKHGDYDRMFIQMGAIETLAARGRVKCLNVERGERPEQPRAYAGVLVTGSDAMVTDRLPWSEA
ncbi:MAG: hypothetical protein LBG78_00340, partial [Azoarcus sp.]|nr:hypothetical protein [Azoarcus sp.]